MAEAYPLHWPDGWPRTPVHKRQRSRFDTTFARTRRELIWEIERLGGRYPVVSTNLQLRNRDGEDWWLILGPRDNCSFDDVVVRYRAMAKHYHPDHGGDVAAMSRLNRAYMAAKKAFGRA